MIKLNCKQVDIGEMTNDPFTEEEKQLIKDVFIYMMDYINDDCFTEEDRKHYDSVYIKLS